MSLHLFPDVTIGGKGPILHVCLACHQTTVLLRSLEMSGDKIKFFRSTSTFEKPWKMKKKNTHTQCSSCLVQRYEPSSPILTCNKIFKNSNSHQLKQSTNEPINQSTPPPLEIQTPPKGGKFLHPPKTNGWNMKIPPWKRKKHLPHHQFGGSSH